LRGADTVPINGHRVAVIGHRAAVHGVVFWDGYLGMGRGIMDKKEAVGRFEYTLSLLQNKIHKHHPDNQVEVDTVVEILTRGQAYLTKREEGKPVKVVFYDQVVESRQGEQQIRDALVAYNLDVEAFDKAHDDNASK